MPELLSAFTPLQPAAGRSFTYGMLALLPVPFAFYWEGATAATPAVRDWTVFWATNALLALGASVIGNHFWNVASRRVPLYGFIHRRFGPRALELVAIGSPAVGVTWSVRLHVRPTAGSMTMLTSRSTIVSELLQIQSFLHQSANRHLLPAIMYC